MKAGLSSLGACHRKAGVEGVDAAELGYEKAKHEEEKRYKNLFTHSRIGCSVHAQENVNWGREEQSKSSFDCAHFFVKLTHLSTLKIMTFSYIKAQRENDVSFVSKSKTVYYN